MSFAAAALIAATVGASMANAPKLIKDGKVPLSDVPEEEEASIWEKLKVMGAATGSIGKWQIGQAISDLKSVGIGALDFIGGTATATGDNFTGQQKEYAPIGNNITFSLGRETGHGLSLIGSLLELLGGSMMNIPPLDGVQVGVVGEGVLGSEVVGSVSLGSVLVNEAINSGTKAAEALLGKDTNLKWSNGSGGSKGDSKTPDKVNYDSKQLGKKYGEHMKDYPEMKDYSEYKDFADEIFKSPDQIIHDVKKGEYFYTYGENLLRIKENGDFISLYPGAESARVFEAIHNGGAIWP